MSNLILLDDSKQVQYLFNMGAHIKIPWLNCCYRPLFTQLQPRTLYAELLGSHRPFHRAMSYYGLAAFGPQLTNSADSCSLVDMACDHESYYMWSQYLL